MLYNPFSQNVAQALQAENVNLVFAAKLEFESGTSRVHSGTGAIEILNESYIGVGLLGQLGTVKEQNTTSATQVTLTMGGLDTSSIATILNEKCVGKLVSLYIAACDDDFNVIDADLLYSGKIRDTTLLGGSQGAINYTLSNIFEDWASGKPWRYTDESQKKLNGGDRIFRYVAQMSNRSIYWGSAKDAPPFNYL